MNFNFKGAAKQIGIGAVGSAIGVGVYKLAEDGICRLSNRILRKREQRAIEEAERVEKRKKKEEAVQEGVSEEVQPKKKKEVKEG